MTQLKSVALALGVGLLQSCTSATAPDWTRGLGLLLEGTPPMTSLIAPSAVHPGVSFAVTASSFGSGSCTEADGYQLDAGAARAEIRLYDKSAPPQSICTEDLRSFPRELLLRFEQPGTVEVVVIGRDYAGGPREVRQTITVLPE